MKNAAIMGLLILLASSAFSEVLPYTTVTCGDQRFGLSVSLNASSDIAKVNFSGDIRPEVTSAEGSYVFTSGQSVLVTLAGDDQGIIKIDGSDSVHDIYFGAYLPGDGSVVHLGLCDVR